MNLRSTVSDTAGPATRRDRETTEKGKELQLKKREAKAVCQPHEAHFSVLEWLVGLDTENVMRF